VTFERPVKPELSIVIPIKNERENIEELIQRIKGALAPLKRAFEIIYVDDGSTDGSYELLEELSQHTSELRVLKFDRNYGQTAALDAGFRHARGTTIVMMDGDLQNDPNDIPRLLERLQYSDMVCGYRARRKDSWFRRTQSRIANVIRNWITHDAIIDTGCTLKAFRTHCLQSIKLYEGMHRFLPTLFRHEGFRVEQMPVNHLPRTRGQTKYSMANRMFKALKDLLAVRWMQKRSLRYKIQKEL
jgi:dolichol-phosphate mannosyltransferase